VRFLPVFWAPFFARHERAKKPGYPLQSFLPLRGKKGFPLLSLAPPSDSSGIVYASHKQFRWFVSYAQFAWFWTHNC
jgi:hypothetical protein